MSEQIQIIRCENCQTQVNTNYCSNCGRAQKLTRIDGQYILSEIGRVLNFDRGILFTIKELLIRPGDNVKRFIHKDRNRLVKPLVFILICSLVYTVAQQTLKFEDGYVNAGDFGESTSALIFSWIQKNYGYANVLMSIFISFWIKILFRKYDYNIYEIIILLCFVMGVGMLMYSVFGIVETITNIKVLQVGGMLGVLYSSWAIGRFFDKKKIGNYFKGFLAYFIGMLTFFLLAIALGMAIDYFRAM